MTSIFSSPTIRRSSIAKAPTSARNTALRSSIRRRPSNAAALAYIADLKSRHVYSSKIVTVVAPLRGFYPAEAYHQDYAVHNPQNPYIVFNDLPKMHKLRQEYPALVKPNAPF